MDETTGIGGAFAEDHEFEVAQDGEIPAESATAEVDADGRPVGDDAGDDVVGIDEERRVVLPEERAAETDE
ncbi:hypothetical protein [Agromyces arachidis]|uniref:hypothetical protein n=1 Tax=Agromyces arachidis TaxID=766966 RepID=UPI0040579C13